MTGLLNEVSGSNISEIDDEYNSNYNYRLSKNTISSFYENTNVFLTGGTGFVGKALLEKLLRSCPGIQCIYLLMRPKKGRTVEQRLEELLTNPVFGRLRENNSNVFKKIKPVSGDISLLNLGIRNPEVVAMLGHVDIIFHSAATVKFNEDLKNALIYNTLGTKRVLDFCCSLEKLKCFVYVSTAFSNSDKGNIDESVYRTSVDPETILGIIDNLSKDDFDILSKKLLGNHPNTYTLTKAMAEQIVSKFSGRVPCVIVRPSIITAAWKEPYPGWVDSVSGITGIFMECGRGTIKSIICNEKYRMDIIPVDIVVNTLIASAWHTTQHRSKALKVYNCVSGQINPITWVEFKSLTQKYSREFPSKYVTWYPGFTYRTNRLIHIFCANLYQILPSAILDIYLYCTGRKPIMLKISKKFYDAVLTGSFFSTNEWNFEVSTMKKLVKAVNNASDGQNFETDIDQANGFIWEKYVKNFNFGVRQYILKDSFSTLEQAKKKIQRKFYELDTKDKFFDVLYEHFVISRHTPCPVGGKLLKPATKNWFVSVSVPETEWHLLKSYFGFRKVLKYSLYALYLKYLFHIFISGYAQYLHK